MAPRGPVRTVSPASAERRPECQREALGQRPLVSGSSGPSLSVASEEALRLPLPPRPAAALSLFRNSLGGREGGPVLSGCTRLLVGSPVSPCWPGVGVNRLPPHCGPVGSVTGSPPSGPLSRGKSIRSVAGSVLPASVWAPSPRGGLVLRETESLPGESAIGPTRSRDRGGGSRRTFP